MHLADRIMSALSSGMSELAFSETNPVTDEAVGEILRTLGVTVPAPDYQVYTSLLKGAWETWNQVDQMGDYVLQVDEDRFPRENVHRAKSEENASNAWAWKCTIKDLLPNQGLLAGKTVCMKASMVFGERGLTTGHYRCQRCPMFVGDRHVLGLGSKHGCDSHHSSPRGWWHHQWQRRVRESMPMGTVKLCCYG